MLAVAAALAAATAYGPGRDVAMRALTAARVDSAPASQLAPASTSNAAVAIAASPGGSAVAMGFTATGYVVARRKSSVSTEISGRVVEVLVDEGDIIAEGKTLARLDDRLARSDVELASAKLTSAVAARDVAISSQAEAHRILERTQQLATHGYATVAELTRTGAQATEADARLRQSIADIAAADETLKRARTTLSLHEIRAPFTGVVVLRSAEPGEVVSATTGGSNRASICTLVDLASLEVEVEVNEGTFSRVALGMATVVAFDGLPNVSVPGHVTLIVPTGNRDKATVKVRVKLSRKIDRLFPDMTARVVFLQSIDEIRQGIRSPDSSSAQTIASVSQGVMP